MNFNPVKLTLYNPYISRDILLKFVKATLITPGPALFMVLFTSPVQTVQAQYIMLGDSRDMMNGCIQLTSDTPYAEGIAYNRHKLNLDSYFQIEFDIYLGDKEEGADGITFVIHNDPRGFGAYGTFGECMGYGRFNPARPGTSISPSVAIEFDTYQNPWQNDPSSDHVAYLENGSNLHNGFWNNGEENFDLEDNKLHSFYFRWDPGKKEITVLLDGYVVYKGTRDLLRDIFSNQTDVIWGFTASTGRAHNHQYFCLRRIVRNQ